MEGEGHFFNRNLSWLDYNHRVLEEGLRPDLPVLGRLRFLSIFSSNLDEFFMIRIAEQKHAAASQIWQDLSGIGPTTELAEASKRIHAMLENQNRCLKNEILPALSKEGLEYVPPDNYSQGQREYLEALFLNEIFPILTPLRIDDEGKLPFIGNHKTYAAFLLAGKETPGVAADTFGTADVAGSAPGAAPVAASGAAPVAAGGAAGGAASGTGPKELVSIVEVPPSYNTVVWLPEEDAGRKKWASLEDVIMQCGGLLFQGHEVKERFSFRVTKDADFTVDDLLDEGFIEALEAGIHNRDYSAPVRLVCGSGSIRLRDEMAQRLGLEKDDIYEVEKPVVLNLASLDSIMSIKGYDHLRVRRWKSYSSPEFAEGESIWDRIRMKDVLLHLPYYSFDPVLRFFQEAAQDPQVLAIKTTLYRTSGDSPIIKALELAAMNGKQVTAVVELKARFDEKRNISWAHSLEKAGVIVVYGISRLKIHAKVALVARRESAGIKRYIHVSTGNYNDKTARLYQDIGLFTAREELVYEAGLLFNMITGYSAIHRTTHLAIAPTTLKQRLLALIDREAHRAGQGASGRIIAKMNSLSDPDIIEALYRASLAGVKITLNVRGICMLKPDVRGLSENIRVVSIIDGYLEHSRVFYFENGGAAEVFISSADWMPRNLERRVELMFPIVQEDIKKELIEILDACFRDNCNAWQLEKDGEWSRIKPDEGEALFRVQEHFHNKARESVDKPWTPRQEFIVHRSPPEL